MSDLGTEIFLLRSYEERLEFLTPILDRTKHITFDDGYFDLYDAEPPEGMTPDEWNDWSEKHHLLFLGVNDGFAPVLVMALAKKAALSCENRG